jgi:branched-chain amino acid transport system ATP-binding protein
MPDWEIEMLDFEQVAIDIQGNTVVRDATFSVTHGSVTGLVGRNGAGKTTILRGLMGILPVKRGSIHFEANPIEKSPAFARAELGIGYMPEDRRLISSMTVEENILLPAWAVKPEGVEKRLAWIYSLIPECKSFADRRASFLSGGQQKLVALARALMAGSKLLVLDEPTEGVAPILASRLIEILSSLAEEEFTVIIAESSPERIEAFSNKIYLVERGVVTFEVQ